MSLPPTSAEFGTDLMVRLDQLAALSESSEYLVRRCFTPEHRRANDLVGQWMAEAGMTVRIDEIGNVIGRYEGLAPGAPALLTGSHLDTVVDAGRYDGMLGVVTPIACVNALHQSGQRFDFAIEVIGFADEEGVRFQSTYLGSRAIAGTFDPSLLERVDADGIRMNRAMCEFGLDPARVGEARRAALSDIEAAIAEIAKRRAIDVSVQQTHDAASAPCATWMQSQLGDAVESVCGRVLSLPSGAGHDSAAMTALTDVGMIFVRCKGGVSHNRAESITAADADAGVRALLHFFQRFRTEF